MKLFMENEEKRKGESKFKLITAKYFYRFLAKMSDIKIQKILEISDLLINQL